MALLSPGSVEKQNGTEALGSRGSYTERVRADDRHTGSVIGRTAILSRLALYNQERVAEGIRDAQRRAAYVAALRRGVRSFLRELEQQRLAKNGCSEQPRPDRIELRSNPAAAPPASDRLERLASAPPVPPLAEVVPIRRDLSHQARALIRESPERSGWLMPEDFEPSAAAVPVLSHATVRAAAPVLPLPVSVPSSLSTVGIRSPLLSLGSEEEDGAPPSDAEVRDPPPVASIAESSGEIKLPFRD